MARLFFPFFIMFALAVIVPAAMLVLARIAGPRRPSVRKLEPYECGIDTTVGHAHSRFSVKYFIVAMCFLIFDIEVVFLYPWAVRFRWLGMYGAVEMFLFIAVLLAGYIYIWKKGAFEWE